MVSRKLELKKQGLQHTQAYAYDRQSQLIAAQSASPSSTIKTTTAASDARVWRYHYDRNGNRVLAQENVPVTEMGHTRKSSYNLDSNATLSPALDREYVWNAQGQLIAIRQENRELARYRPPILHRISVRLIYDLPLMLATRKTVFRFLPFALQAGLMRLSASAGLTMRTP